MKHVLVFFLIVLGCMVGVVWFLAANTDTQLLDMAPSRDGSHTDGAAPDTSAPSPDVLDATGVMYVYTIAGTPNSAAAVNLQFNQTGGHPILNLALDLNGDGEYAAYETEDGLQEEWVVANLPAAVEADSSNSYQLAIVDTSLYGKQQIFGYGTFSEAPVSARWLDNAEANGKRIRLAVRSFEVGSLIGSTMPGNGPSVYRGGASSGLFDFIAQVIGSMRVTRSVDIDVPYDTPDITQGVMECAPAVLANNIQALATAFNADEQLPDTSTLLEELKETLKFGDDSIDGVLVRNFVAGTNEFMQDHELPVVTREILNPTFEDIVDAVAADAVLALDLALYDHTGSEQVHVASHLVTVTGASQRNDLYVLRGRDSATPEAEETWQFIPKSASAPMAQLQYPMWQKGSTRIKRLYIHEWVSTEEAIAAGVLSPGTKIRTYPTTMLKIGTDFYPIDQFTLVASAACGGVFYAKEGTAIGLKFRDRRDLTYLSSDRTGVCGYGKVSDVPTEDVALTWYQQQLLTTTLSRDR